MPTILLPVPHRQQEGDADCLAACAAMLLAFVGQPVEYSRLLKLLRVRSFGTPGANLLHLADLGVKVEYVFGSMDELRVRLEEGTPCLTLVSTADLPHWLYATDHAVVVVGLQEQAVILNDPAFPTTPLAVPTSAFELAWQAFDYRYAVIRR